MITHMTYRDSTHSLFFTEWLSLEQYLLKWISKPVTLVVHFETLSEQIRYFFDFSLFYQSVISAQFKLECSEWVVTLYGFDNQPYLLDLAA